MRIPKCAKLTFPVAAARNRKHKSMEMYVGARECEICEKERREKALVATDANDARFYSNQFNAAPAIFPNNDLKYDANKRRAALYAEVQNASITCSCAKDIVSAQAFKKDQIYQLKNCTGCNDTIVKVVIFTGCCPSLLVCQ